MSLFQKPKWAKSASTTDPEETSDASQNLFSHSSTYIATFREQTERNKKRAEKQKQHDEEVKIKKEEKKKQQRRSSEKRKSEEGEDKDVSKRRRITAEESNKLLARVGLGSNVINLSDDEEEEPAPQPVRRSPRNNRTRDVLSPKKTRNNLNNPIDLGDESEADIQITATAKRAPPPPPEPEEEYDSDPYFASLQRNARERAKENSKPQTTRAPPSNAAITPDVGVQLPTPPPAADPPASIFITSIIADTEPLIVYRKLSQRLREVKEAWCQKNKLPRHQWGDVFLVHRGRRFYDSTTVKRLGLELNEAGEVYMTSPTDQEDEEHYNANVHVEVVTQDIFEQMKADRARAARIASGEYEEDDEAPQETPAEEEAPTPAPAEQRQIKLVIKAKGKPEFKVKVTPGTLIQKIIRAAKRSFGFSDEDEVRLEWDGEPLEPNETVGNTEIEDEDNLEMFLDN